MNSQEIRKKFLDFFAARGHAVAPSSSLIPDDPSVLFATAGMQQFKRYYTSELDAMKDFKSKNVVSVQKCFRTSDIDEVGDASHLTFFEMLGNFSFGGYFKEGAITLAHEFITKEMGLAIDCVSVFAGDTEVPADVESEKIWKSLGVRNIKRAGREDNFWGPTGAEGPCGPTTEIYVKTVPMAKPSRIHGEVGTAGESVEIWNIVFNEYYSKDRKLTPLKTPGVDTGMGLERLTMVVQKVPTIFETDLFQPLIKLLPATLPERTRRILADHVRGIAFLISDGVRPSNKEAGYVLRRLMRRVVTHEHLLNKKQLVLPVHDILETTIKEYKSTYPNLDYDIVIGVWMDESIKFLRTLEQGLREMEKIEIINAAAAFKLYESYGLPYEIVKELGGAKAASLTRKDFDKEFAKHQEISRAGVEKKFGGHGLVLNTGEIKAGSEEELKKVTRYHTATHLLHQALREVLGTDVSQRGSDITPERTRFDFSFPRKVTSEELKKVEDIVNEKIGEDLPVQYKEMLKEDAEKTGALHFFKAKYPERVKVYYVGKSLETAWNKEFCGGPHVARTGEIGTFKITKEEASSAGVRRIRATVS